MIEIDRYDSYDAIHQIWRDMNHRYKGGEMALDWELHHELWYRFHAEDGDLLNILVASESGSCIGIFPFSRAEIQGSADTESEWVLGEDTLISREYFCPPERIGEIVSCLPPHSATDLSCFYRPGDLDRFVSRRGCIVNLMPSESEYLLSIQPKHRADYLKTERMNADIEVLADNAVREHVVGELREQYIEYWMTKNEHRGKREADDSRKKILRDFVLFHQAEKLGKLVVLYFYVKGRLVAANFAVRRETDRVDDYLCLRSTDKAYLKRRLGVYAIIRNMQHCRSLGVRYYDLSDFHAAYKESFVNTAYHYWTPRMGEVVDTDIAEREPLPVMGDGKQKPGMA